MYISNDNTKNYSFYSLQLETQLNEQTNQNLIKLPKVVKPTNNKTSPISFPSQAQYTKGWGDAKTPTNGGLILILLP